jgi:hypothetical protein
LLLTIRLVAFTQAITQITSLSLMRMKSNSGIAAVEQVTAADNACASARACRLHSVEFHLWKEKL